MVGLMGNSQINFAAEHYPTIGRNLVVEKVSQQQFSDLTHPDMRILLPARHFSAQED